MHTEKEIELLRLVKIMLSHNDHFQEYLNIYVDRKTIPSIQVILKHYEHPIHKEYNIFQIAALCGDKQVIEQILSVDSDHIREKKSSKLNDYFSSETGKPIISKFVKSPGLMSYSGGKKGFLVNASKNGHAELVRFLLENEEDRHLLTSDLINGGNAMEHAIVDNDIQALSLLLQYHNNRKCIVLLPNLLNQSLNNNDNDLKMHVTILMSIACNNANSLGLLLSQLDLSTYHNSSYASYAPALPLAAALGNLDSVKLLVNHGFNLFAKDKNGFTAIIIAKHSHQVEMIEFLTDKVGLRTHTGRILTQRNANVAFSHEDDHQRKLNYILLVSMLGQESEIDPAFVSHHWR